MELIDRPQPDGLHIIERVTETEFSKYRSYTYQEEPGKHAFTITYETDSSGILSSLEFTTHDSVKLASAYAESYPKWQRADNFKWIYYTYFWGTLEELTGIRKEMWMHEQPVEAYRYQDRTLSPIRTKDETIFEELEKDETHLPYAVKGLFPRDHKLYYLIHPIRIFMKQTNGSLHDFHASIDRLNTEDGSEIYNLKITAEVALEAKRPKRQTITTQFKRSNPLQVFDMITPKLATKAIKV